LEKGDFPVDMLTDPAGFPLARVGGKKEKKVKGSRKPWTTDFVALGPASRQHPLNVCDKDRQSSKGFAKKRVIEGIPGREEAFRGKNRIERETRRRRREEFQAREKNFLERTKGCGERVCDAGVSNVEEKRGRGRSSG